MQSVEAIERLAARLKQSNSVYERISILDEEPLVVDFLQREHPLRSFLAGLSSECESALKQLIAIGEAPLEQKNISAEAIRDLIGRLVAIDEFYREFGGVAGYQLQVQRLLRAKEADRADTNYHSPFFIDISRPSDEVEQAIEKGIEAMPFMCEMYPLGGAADRLHLLDEKTGSELPAAKLEFGGRTLLEGLLKDLEAREHLYFQRTGKVLTTPVAIMTSHEKNNWIHIRNILEENDWFGRPKESFRIFVQPLVPAVNEKGEWRWIDSWKPLLKPGGHGAIWKLAKDNGIFEWLKGLGVKYALIRQINNPLAGLDYGLLAFTGIGSSRQMSFGFASCPRFCQAAEGVNVLIEKKTKNGYSYVVSNIEYCDFAKYGIEDRPLHEGEPYSRFSSNTNILFADLKELEDAVGRCPFPGLLMNLKKSAGSKNEAVGRLESTMQNIADVFTEEKAFPIDGSQDCLKKTFVTYNARNKTISPAKKAYVKGGLLNETPENCFFDLMAAHRELLTHFCRYILPPPISLEQMIESHPPFVFLFHPSLGPLFKTIGEKLRGGRLGEGSEIRLQIASADLENLEVDGSLQIQAKQPLGMTRFTSSIPRCALKNVKVVNRGVDWENSKPFWKGFYARSGSLVIALEGKSEFIAENVCFEGDLRFEVNDGERLIVTQDGSSLKTQRERVL